MSPNCFLSFDSLDNFSERCELKALLLLVQSLVKSLISYELFHKTKEQKIKGSRYELESVLDSINDGFKNWYDQRIGIESDYRLYDRTSVESMVKSIIS